ncbi:MAG: NAD(P)-binding domain-containing protein [Proteobacteria bacterium]|nr:NAD(P)-binding domain-containing protein [Pseudomonadota bacterium]
MTKDAQLIWRDYLVIGAGPAGLQLGYFFEKSDSDYLILEAADEVGSFFRLYPRGRQLISFNKVSSIYEDPEIQLRWDWNSLLSDYEFPFREFSRRLYPLAGELREYLAAFASHYRINIQFDTRITRIARRSSGEFRLCDGLGRQYGCRTLIVATGIGKPFIPQIEGIEQVTEGYENVATEPDDFLGQRVLIIGKGNSAFEIADNMLGTAALVHLASPTPIRMAWKTRHPGNVRADHARILDTYQLKLLNGALDCQIRRIERDDEQFLVTVQYSHADDEVEQLVYDRVIRCTGFCFDNSIFDRSCRPELVIEDKLPRMTPRWESSNVEGMYFAGTLMQSRDFKKSSSAFIDGYRYNIRTLHNFLRERNDGIALPCSEVAATGGALTEHVLGRICRTSGLWAQFGHLCDLIVVDEAGQLARYYEELPVDYVHQSEFGDQPHYYMVTFEWGTWHGDPFNIPRHPSHETAYTNAFLHPIIRRYQGQRVVHEHHVLEDLFGMYSARGESGAIRRRSGRTMEEYHQAEHHDPLYRFFDAQLAGASERKMAIS